MGFSPRDVHPILLVIPVLLIPIVLLWKYIYCLFVPLENTSQHGGQLVAQVLKSHGVKWIFTLIGGHISPILVASEELGIKVIDVRHEATTVFAADAVSRLTGVPGVAIVTAGPGVTNTVTALKNAQMAQSPLVLIGGASATVLKGRGSLQDVEQIQVVKSIVKYYRSIDNVRDIVPTMRRAFYEALSGVPGPVFIEIPIDCLYCIGEVMSAMRLAKTIRANELREEQHSNVIIPDDFANGDSEREASLKAYLKSLPRDTAPVYLANDGRKMPMIVKAYLSFMTRYIFAGAFNKQWDTSPIEIHEMLPSVPQITSVIDVLLKAKRPVLIVGSQALLNASEKDLVREAVETLGVPTFLSGMARGLLGTKSKIFLRQGRTAALREADVIILAGVMVDFRLDYGRVLSRKAKIIAINRCYADLKLNTDFFWKPYIKIQADVSRTLIPAGASVSMKGRYAQTERVKQYQSQINGDWEKWRLELKTREAIREQNNLKKSTLPSLAKNELDCKAKELLNSLYVCNRIEEEMAEDAVMIVDGGDFAATAAYTVRPRKPLGWLDPGPFGTLGVGAGFALGAKLVDPQAEVWLIWGDGSCGYSIAEIDTFRRFGLGVICVIGNDACWTQIEREQIPKLGSDVATKLAYLPYDTVSIGFGGGGATVFEKAGLDSNDEKNVLRMAKEFVVKEKRPFVINAHIGASDFREGSVSV